MTGTRTPGAGTQVAMGPTEDHQTIQDGEVEEVHPHQGHLQHTIARTQGDLRAEDRRPRSCTGRQDAGGDLPSTIAKKKYIENNQM